MNKVRFFVVLAVLLCPLLSARADDYNIDTAHASVTFKIEHLGIAWIHGRFNDFSGDFSLDGDKAAFNLNIKAESIDTANKKRDDHLRSPDFFNVKQFPAISFKSTAVKTTALTGLKVTGDLTMHGETKSVTFNLAGGKTAEFPKGVERIGYTAELTLKRADFGMKGFEAALGSDVHIAISFEGVKKK